MNRNDQQFMAQRIRTQYMEKESTELDSLRELDRKVKMPANIFSYVFGSIGAVVMGSGMSLVMTDIAETVGLGANPIALGIVIGIAGLAMALVNFPIHKLILNSRKKKFAGEIVALSDKIMNNK